MPVDSAIINASLLDRLDVVISALYPERRATVTSREIRLGRHGSLAIDRSRGMFFDHEAGTGGDMIALVQHAKGCDFKAALEYGSALLGGQHVIHKKIIKPTVCEPREQELTFRRMEKARRIWRECSPVTGTLAERYLREHRGITLMLPLSLRFHPSLPYARDPRLSFPALVAAVQGVSREIIGIHSTFLNPETGNKIALDNLPARLSIGVVKGGAVRLAPVNERLVVTEGVEDALSIMQACPGASAWATLGTSGMKGVILPENVHEVVIAGDNDVGGRVAAEALRQRLHAEGRKVAITYPEDGCKDFNAMLRGVAS